MSGRVERVKTSEEFGVQAASGDRPPLVEVSGLRVRLPSARGQFVEAVKSASLTIRRGERVGLVGESGSGKSVTARAISGLLPESRLVSVTGSIKYEGSELVGASQKTWLNVKRKRVGMIFQDPLNFLNPTMTVGKQVRESLEQSGAADTSDAELERFLTLAGLHDAHEIRQRYPFELSGGMRQRILIAIAMAKVPDLIIADEPTTALDATVQRRVLKSLDDVVEKLDTSLLLISHDLGVVAGLCNRVYVMYAGEIVEEGTIEKIFYAPEHPYTKELLKCVTSLIDDTPDLYVSNYVKGGR